MIHLNKKYNKMYKRRYLGRRTEKEIEQDVMRAIATIISEKGISSVTIKKFQICLKLMLSFWNVDLRMMKN